MDGDPASDGKQRRAGRLASIGLACLLLAVGCGSRLSHQRLLADARAQAGEPEASSGSATSGSAEQASTGQAQASSGGTVSGPTVAQAAAGDAGPSGGVQSGGATGPSGSGAATVRCSGTKSQIVIGTVGEQSGLVGASVFAGVQAVQAWVAATNANGGLSCHPVKYIVLDDGGDPSRNQALTQELVEQDHALAVVYADAPFAGQASTAYLSAHQIPVIGSETGENWFYSNPTYFPQVSSGDLVLEAAMAAGAEVGLPQGRTKLGTISCVEAAICSDLYNLGPTWAPKFGFTLVYRGQDSIAQPDYTSACQAADAAGAQVLYVGLDASSLLRAFRSCMSINYRPIFLTASSSAPPTLPQQANSDGSVVGMVALPYMVTSNAGIEEYQTTLKRFAPSVLPSVPSITGWVAAKLFELAAQNLRDPPTSLGVLDGLWSVKGNNLGGITGPLSFSKGQNPPRTLCYWVMTISHGQYVSPNAEKGKCLAP